MKKKGYLERIYGGTDNFWKILAINFLIIFIAWPILSNVIALLAFYTIVYPLSLVFVFDSGFFFGVIFMVIYWPWIVYPLGIAVLLGLSYYIMRKNKALALKHGKSLGTSMPKKKSH